jgi:hypothetical protein
LNLMLAEGCSSLRVQQRGHTIGGIDITDLIEAQHEG